LNQIPVGAHGEAGPELGAGLDRPGHALRLREDFLRIDVFEVGRGDGLAERALGQGRLERGGSWTVGGGVATTTGAGSGSERDTGAGPRSTKSAATPPATATTASTAPARMTQPVRSSFMMRLSSAKPSLPSPVGCNQCLFFGAAFCFGAGSSARLSSGQPSSFGSAFFFGSAFLGAAFLGAAFFFFGAAFFGAAFFGAAFFLGAAFFSGAAFFGAAFFGAAFFGATFFFGAAFLRATSSPGSTIAPARRSRRPSSSPRGNPVQKLEQPRQASRVAALTSSSVNAHLREPLRSAG